MESIKLLGLIAGTLTTASFVPQVIKTWKSKSASDLSLAMFATFFLGVVLWLIYGLIVGDIPVIVANVATLLLSGVILYFKIRYK